MKRIIVFNAAGTKGIMVNEPEGQDRFITVKKAGYEFYSPFKNENDLTCSVPYNEDSPICKQLFTHVAFHFCGDGAGRITSYNTTILTTPDERQLKFIGKSEIYCVKFFNQKHYFNAPDDDKGGRFCRCGKYITDEIHHRITAN